MISFLSLLSFLWANFLIICGSDELEYPTVYELEDGGSYQLAVDYCDYIVENLLQFTGRCWCFTDPNNDSIETCSIPGPTLVVYNGTSFSLTVTNRMTGDSATSGTGFKDPDVTNLHTHGLHISSLDDDPLIDINPGESHTYTFDIHNDHYPGNHWYHPHHDGSVAWQLRSGLYGALIVKYGTYSQDSSYYAIEQLKSHVLLIQSIFTYSSETCDCDNGDYKTNFQTKVSRFAFMSICESWCEISDSQREASGTSYDLESLTGSGDATDIDGQTYILINGQYQKTINLYVNDWNILKLFNTGSAQYAQFYLDSDNDEACEFYLLSRDGIYFKNGPRDLNESPTYGYLLIPPGGRAEVAIKCAVEGIYELTTNEDDYKDDFEYLLRMPASQTVLYLNVESTDGVSNIDIISDLPMATPAYPLYLQSLLDEDDENINKYPFVTDCGCPQYDYELSSDYSGAEPELTFEEGDCGFELQFLSPTSGRPVGGINNELWSQQESYLINFETIYEFYVGSNSHPLHQHVNPMQLVDTYLDGILGEKGDWVDTYGNPDDFTYRTITLDYIGHVVLHCHIVDHEDEGMMSLYRINSSLCEADVQPSAAPTFSPTDGVANSPSGAPSNIPTKNPTNTPSDRPSDSPINDPSNTPTQGPTNIPTDRPTNSPTKMPSRAPTNGPSVVPSKMPSKVPSNTPTDIPSNSPINSPTLVPSVGPSNNPSDAPSNMPSHEPSDGPTNRPTNEPSDKITDTPTKVPTKTPSVIPSSMPTNSPTASPIDVPSDVPSNNPSSDPSAMPIIAPSYAPSMNPSGMPSNEPSNKPSDIPSNIPSNTPSGQPTKNPIGVPTISPTSDAPSNTPTAAPLSSHAPSNNPSAAPTIAPSKSPSVAPVNNPTHSPINNPTYMPIDNPSNIPTNMPSGQPTTNPSNDPTITTTTLTTTVTNMPTNMPTNNPINNDKPSMNPTIMPSNDPTMMHMETDSPTIIRVTQYPTKSPNNLPTFSEQACLIAPQICDNSPCSCSEVINCRICHAGQGCSQCINGYFKRDKNSQCQECQETFGNNCLHCADIHGCQQCKDGSQRVYSNENKLWYCESSNCDVTNW